MSDRHSREALLTRNEASSVTCHGNDFLIMYGSVALLQINLTDSKVEIFLCGTRAVKDLVSCGDFTNFVLKVGSLDSTPEQLEEMNRSFRWKLNISSQIYPLATIQCYSFSCVMTGVKHTDFYLGYGYWFPSAAFPIHAK